MQDTLTLILYAFYIALIMSSIGFRRTVWFISIGYALSIVVMCILLAGFYYEYFQIFNSLQVAILGLWGARLGTFLTMRELNTHYTNAVKSQTDESQNQPWTVKFGIWIAVSVLYAIMFSPVVFALQSPVRFGDTYLLVTYIGILIMAAGLIIETVADSQKSKFKETHPSDFCQIGLYAWVRCPNYLGEIMVWTGSLVTALAFMHSWWQWLMGITGWICIVLIMMGSTKRLEDKHIARYGADPEFQKYSSTVPILFPWTKIYSFRNLKFYLG